MHIGPEGSRGPKNPSSQSIFLMFIISVTKSVFLSSDFTFLQEEIIKGYQISASDDGGMSGACTDPGASIRIGTS